MDSSGLEPFERQVDHDDIGPCLAAYGAPLLAFAKPATPGRPSQGPFHYPSSGQDFEAVVVGLAFHHGQQPSARHPCPGHPLTCVVNIGPDQLQPGEVAQQLGQRQLGSVPPELAEGLVMGVRGIERCLEQWEMGVKDVH